MMAFCKALGSLLVVALAVFFGVLIYLDRTPPGVRLDTNAPNQLTSQLSDEQLAAFNRDGVLVVRNLLDQAHVDNINSAIETAYRTTTVMDIVQAVKGGNASYYKEIQFDVWRVDATVANLALQSLPSFVAPMVTQDDSKIRLLRDAYFHYEKGGRGCGWHVDDMGFWPTEPNTAGVTVWIALDDMPDGAGGLVIANQTALTLEQLEECRAAIQGNTCAMEELNPDCHALLDRNQLKYGSLKAGDAIIWNRWVFHRTQTQIEPNTKGKRRYSVRYIPGNARGKGALHNSVKQGGSFEGSPYYPQVYPSLISEETEALAAGLASDMAPWNVAKVLSQVLVDYGKQKLFGKFN